MNVIQNDGIMRYTASTKKRAKFTICREGGREGGRGTEGGREEDGREGGRGEGVMEGGGSPHLQYSQYPEPLDVH